MFFLEAQFQTDNDFYARWFAQIFLFLFRQPTRRTAWRAIVIFRDRSTDSPVAEAYRPLLELPGVRRIYLADLLHRPAPSQGQQLLQLIIEEPATAVAKAQTLLAQSPPPGDTTAWWALADLIETIMVYKLPRLTREEIRVVFLKWIWIAIRRRRVAGLRHARRGSPAMGSGKRTIVSP